MTTGETESGLCIDNPMLTRLAHSPDLHRHAVARASAIHQSQQTRKDTPEKKLRGKKAEKAEVEA